VGLLIARLRQAGVARVGLEASGGYERAVREAVEAAGMPVVIHQPLQVRLFARLKRLKAKNNRLDARLIAAFTAQADGRVRACDPLLAELAERLTVYEQFAELGAELKTGREHATLADLRALFQVQIAQLAQVKTELAAAVCVNSSRPPTSSSNATNPGQPNPPTNMVAPDFAGGSETCSLSV
jgi:transposase